MVRIILAIFIIAHGLVHSVLAIAPDPDALEAKPFEFFSSLDRSLILSKIGVSAEIGRFIGFGLVILATLGFILSGLGILGIPLLIVIWRGLAIGASLVSLILLILFWHKWLPVGVIIDLAVIFAMMISFSQIEELISG